MLFRKCKILKFIKNVEHKESIGLKPGITITILENKICSMLSYNRPSERINTPFGSRVFLVIYSKLTFNEDFYFELG